MKFFGLVFLVASNVLFLNLLMAILLIYLYRRNGLQTKTFGKLTLFAFSFAFIFLLLTVLYPGGKLKTGELFVIGNLKIYENALLKGLHSFFKLFILSLVSMSSIYAIIYTKVILFLIIRKGVKVFIGYVVFIAMNSILLFKDEFERIRLSARFRGLSQWDRLFALFPLLVFAIRHSQRGSLSLVTRGLNPNKNFYFGYDLSPQDRWWLFSYFAVLIIFILIVILHYIA